MPIDELEQITGFDETNLPVLQKIIKQLREEIINIKYTTSTPTASNLRYGELAIKDDGTDQDTYLKTAKNTLVTLLNSTKVDDSTVEVSGGDLQVKLTHDAFVKGWIQFDGTAVGSPASMTGVADSYNVASVLDNGTGDYTIAWDTDFANTDYSVVTSANEEMAYIGTLAVGTTQLYMKDQAANLADPSIVCAIAIGDQA